MVSLFSGKFEGQVKRGYEIFTYVLLVQHLKFYVVRKQVSHETF